jgi:HEAT repeat protein
MALIKKRRGAYTMEISIEALAKIGSPSVPPLVQFLREKNSSLQETAVAALVYIGKPAVPALIGLLYDPDPALRTTAVRGCWRKFRRPRNCRCRRWWKRLIAATSTCA